MKWLLVLFLIITPVYAKVVYTASASSGERLSFHDERKDCPEGTKYVDYYDPRDGEVADGCYAQREDQVLVIMNNGSYAGRPLLLHRKQLKDAI